MKASLRRHPHLAFLVLGATVTTVLASGCRSPIVPADTTGAGGGGIVKTSGSQGSAVTASASSGGTGGGATVAASASSSGAGSSSAGAGGGAGSGGMAAGSGGAGGASVSASSGAASSSSASSSAAASSSASSAAASSSSSSAASSSSSSGGATCAIGHVVFSQIRSRGAAGASDDFIELYNATGAAVTLDSTWVIKVRSATGSTYPARWTGTGKVVPAWGHFLITDSAYTGMPAGDENLTAGITDSASVILNHGNSTVDAVCYYATNLTLAAATTDYANATCMGTPVSNAPHTDNSGAASDVDVSLVRKPGGAGNNCVDTGDSAADFTSETPAVPRNSASAPTP